MVGEEEELMQKIVGVSIRKVESETPAEVPKTINSTVEYETTGTQKLADKLCAIDGVERAFSAPVFHEVALTLPQDADTVLARLAEKDILGGLSLAKDYSMKNAILVNSTEVHTEGDLDLFAQALKEVLA